MKPIRSASLHFEVSLDDPIRRLLRVAVPKDLLPSGVVEIWWLPNAWVAKEWDPVGWTHTALDEDRGRGNSGHRSPDGTLVELALPTARIADASAILAELR
mmetsp:Transcript_46257/g.83344  ORF Transcript_46257/g.83344 Transcript_46257/m.83344 type:complete len:101 (-) Transcript_46257:491-793(-)